jgi:hypothetical protein
MPLKKCTTSRGLSPNYRSPIPLGLVQPPTARLVRDAGRIVAVKADNDNGRSGMELLQAVMQNILR